MKRKCLFQLTFLVVPVQDWQMYHFRPLGYTGWQLWGHIIEQRAHSMARKEKRDQGPPSSSKVCPLWQRCPTSPISRRLGTRYLTDGSYPDIPFTITWRTRTSTKILVDYNLVHYNCFMENLDVRETIIVNIVRTWFLKGILFLIPFLR